MSYRRRRVIGLLIIVAIAIVGISANPANYAPVPKTAKPPVTATDPAVLKQLNALTVKGRAPKTGYERTQFGNGWHIKNGCDTRNRILQRDLQDAVINDACQVTSGVLHDPYTGKTLNFTRGASTSQQVQIDHVVALSNAWQTGAQQLSLAVREKLANDPLELLAVDGAANQQKGDGDAATWLPSNTLFRCQYVERQIRIKTKYHLWVTPPEKAAMERVLRAC